MVLQIKPPAAKAFLLGLCCFSAQIGWASPFKDPVATDRWLEIDLYWFKQGEITPSVQQFWDRFQPLFAGVQGDRGVILNIGWTVGPVMEWSGNLDQRISLPTGKGQSRWVEQIGQLTGSTEERQRQAKARFAKTVILDRRSYDPWTYADVKLLTAALKAEAARRDLGGVKIGLMNYAWNHAYGEESAWSKRHPEAYTKVAFSRPNSFDFGPYLDPGARLHADPVRLGGLPDGIKEGLTVSSAYAAQWGSLSQALGLDAIMLRDSFGMPVPYQRGGPWGVVAPTPGIISKATTDAATLVREVKLANPAALVMMYSNASSAVSDWRANGMDLSTIAKQGYLDIWVDQTWAGAWNEVGLREETFWNYGPTNGWTYQLGFMLVHAAILADTKVRHYPLVETFDSWEGWDVIHTAPEKLRWAIWAYAHAAVKTPQGVKVPAGSYISWANQGDRLLDERDVQFLSDNINAAVSDASRIAEVVGPTLVYNREAMQWQADHATPEGDIAEWIDEQMASVAKWPVPILSATTLEWMPQVQSDLFIVQTPIHLAPERLGQLADAIKRGQPLALWGRARGGIDPALAQLAGLHEADPPTQGPVSKRRAATQAPDLVLNAPPTFEAFYHPARSLASAEARVLYTVEGSPALTLNQTAGKQVSVWNPPDLQYGQDMPLAQIWGNTGAPYALAAGALSELLKANSALHAASIDVQQTMSISAWRNKDGSWRILAANLEEGLRHDADHSRQATLMIPPSWQTTTWRDVWTGRTYPTQNGALRIELTQAASVLLESLPAPEGPALNR